MTGTRAKSVESLTRSGKQEESATLFIELDSTGVETRSPAQDMMRGSRIRIWMASMYQVIK